MHAYKLDHPRVWRTYRGGTRLDGWTGTTGVSDGQHPEEWVASVTEARNPTPVPGEGLSRAEDGELLRDLIERDRTAMLGAGRDDLGALVKIIDADERLTVQVHPDRKCARELFDSEYGKTECWYFLDDGQSLEGERPYVYYGFKEGVTRERWEELFGLQDIDGMLACLNRIEVEPSMVVLVRGGVPHALGKGCFLIEVQEPTDYTIRVERVTPSGLHVADESCHQGLGFARMFDCFDYMGWSYDEAVASCVVTPKRLVDEGDVVVDELVGYDSTPCFAMERISFRSPGMLGLSQDGDYRILHVTAGSGMLHDASANGEDIVLTRGDQIFVPAAFGHLDMEMGAGSEVLSFRGPQVG